MLIRSLVLVLIVAFSFSLVAGQSQPVAPKQRDLPFLSGVDLQFLIRELARDMGINVLFDSESFRVHGRKVFIELKNVTSFEALDYILLQEGLFFEEAGPKTILVAVQGKQRSIPHLGVGIVPMRDQLAQFFGVEGGLLIDWVRDNSPASKAGLQVGDVLAEINGVAVKGTLAGVRAVNEKKDSDVVLTIVRERKRKAIRVTPEKASVGSIVQKSS